MQRTPRIYHQCAIFTVSNSSFKNTNHQIHPCTYIQRMCRNKVLETEAQGHLFDSHKESFLISVQEISVYCDFHYD